MDIAASVFASASCVFAWTPCGLMNHKSISVLRRITAESLITDIFVSDGEHMEITTDAAG